MTAGYQDTPEAPRQAHDQRQGSRAAPRTNPVYGRVFFVLCREFDLTVTECLLVDIVTTLSKRTGWCFASRGYLADLLGISTRSLRRTLAALTKRGIVEPHPRDIRQLRTTEHYRRAMRICGADRSATEG